MLGLLAWWLLDEPIVLRPRELPPWVRRRVRLDAVCHLRDPEREDRRLAFGEDSMFGVCDPKAYGFREAEHPRAGDVVCWFGDRGLLSRASRYVSGCRFAHQGIVIADGVVGHITLGGWVEEPIPSEAIVFDNGFSEAERANFIAHFRDTKRPVGYGYHAAIFVAVVNVGCVLSHKSNAFHLLDTLTLAGLLWLLGIPAWVPGVWCAVAAVRVGLNYAIQYPGGAPLA